MNELKKYRITVDRHLLSISCILAGSLSLVSIFINSLFFCSPPSASLLDGFRSVSCYPAGVYQVGSQIPAGEYVLYCDSFLAYFELTKEDQVISDSVSRFSIVTLENGQTFSMERCHAVPIQAVSGLDITGDGMFQVGVHLPAGSYTLEMDADSPLGYGYAEISENSSHRPDSVSRQILVRGKATVTVSDGEYLKLCRCRILPQ